MKVVCESCQAKYQVPDERVAGKKLKIRCKRCGATVLIRGDLSQSGLADSPQPAASAAGAIAPDSLAPALDTEWHASVDGESYGPFDTNGLLIWLGEQVAGWDAHVWREGFTDWQLARDVAELTAITGGGIDAALPYPSPISTPDPFGPESVSPQELEGPTHDYGAGDLYAPGAATGSNGSGQRSQDPRARGSSIRTRSSPSLAAAGSLSNTWSGSPAAASSPRVTAAQALTGERNEDSVLFSTANLQQVAMTTSQPGYGHAASPGYASGEASGLIDIRALASLARQTTPQISPNATYDRFRAEDDSRMAVMNQTGAFNRVDSLAPVSTGSQSSSAAVPLAILGGFALVAAAAFAAILITREAEPPAQAVAVVPDTPAPAHAARPTITQEPSAPTPPPAAPEPAAAPAAAAPEQAAQAAEAEAEGEAESEDDLLAGAKTKRQRGARTAAEDKKETLPVEKAKPKKEEKSAPPSSDEVMVATKHTEPAPEAKPESKPEPKPAATSGSDLDALLAGKPTKPAPAASSKSRSIDDLLSGASDSKKPAAPAPAAAPVAAAPADVADEGDELPPAPSRDETLAAMRGVEAAVRACGGDQPLKGTAEVQITVAGTTGRVTNATVSGITGESGSCIARAARNAKFPRFSKPTFSIKYPYRFQ